MTESQNELKPCDEEFDRWYSDRYYDPEYHFTSEDVRDAWQAAWNTRATSPAERQPTDLDLEVEREVRFRLFSHMSQEHGVTLLETEIEDIMVICRESKEKRQVEAIREIVKTYIGHEYQECAQDILESIDRMLECQKILEEGNG